LEKIEQQIKQALSARRLIKLYYATSELEQMFIHGKTIENFPAQTMDHYDHSAKPISMNQITTIVENLADSLPSHSYDQIRRTWYGTESIQIVESWRAESELSDSSALDLCLGVVAAHSTMRLMEKLDSSHAIDFLYITQSKPILTMRLYDRC
jgi:hypothetical protein